MVLIIEPVMFKIVGNSSYQYRNDIYLFKLSYRSHSGAHDCGRHLHHIERVDIVMVADLVLGVPLENLLQKLVIIV